MDSAESLRRYSNALWLRCRWNPSCRGLFAESGFISVQVLNEFTAVGSRKPSMPLGDIHEVLGTIRDICRTEPLTLGNHDRAGEIMERYKFSFYHSVIVASALHAHCKTLYSEDLQHDQVIDEQLRVANPFKQG